MCQEPGPLTSTLYSQVPLDFSLLSPWHLQYKMWNFIYSFVHPGVFLGLTISVYRSVLYPDFFPPAGLPPLGNVTLTSDLENCNSLARIAITIETDAVYTNYFIGFSTSTNLGGIYIGEAKFSDEAISTRSSM